jgi:outer membrane protein OmpA-like peptidoglycan-associated protein
MFVKGKLKSFLIVWVFVSFVFSFWGCQPKETYQAPKDYEDFEDLRVNKQKKSTDKEEEAAEEEGSFERRNVWEDVESLQESWFEDWGDTQKNVRKGLDYFRVGLYDEAQREFEKAIDYDSHFAPAYIELGRTFLAKNMPYAAEKALKDATRLDPSLPRSYYYLGVTYCKLWEIEGNEDYKELANKQIRNALKIKADIPDPADILDGDCIKPIEEDFYTILIKSQPKQAIAHLGETEIGETPVTIKTRLDNIHDITAIKDGYIMQRKSIRFGEEQTATLSLFMRSAAQPLMEERSVAEGIFLEHDAIYFDLDKATIRPESYSVLDKIGAELLQFPEYKVSIEGHTCNLGTNEYNLGLSKRRAQAVADYLAQNFDIDRARFQVKGFGETQPIASNETEAGRRKNRRTEIIILEDF